MDKKEHIRGRLVQLLKEGKNVLSKKEGNQFVIRDKICAISYYFNLCGFPSKFNDISQHTYNLSSLTEIIQLLEQFLKDFDQFANCSPYTTLERFWVRNFEDLLRQYHDLFQDIHSPGMMGEGRENIFVKFLQKLIPSKYCLDKGKIFDLDGNQSPQVDLVIRDAINYPRIFEDKDESQKWSFLIYTVFLMMEIKSNLNKEKLKEALLNVQSCRKLQFTRLFSRFSDKANRIDRPINLIFAYDTDWKDPSTILENIREVCLQNSIQPMERFDLLYILKKG